MALVLNAAVNSHMVYKLGFYNWHSILARENFELGLQFHCAAVELGPLWGGGGGGGGEKEGEGKKISGQDSLICLLFTAEVFPFSQTG